MGEKHILVVGAGFSGATFARLAAEDDVRVDVIDRRDHIGGNCFSYEDGETGVEVHKYGPHIFHTCNESVFRFVSRFTNLNPFVHRVKAVCQGRDYPLPVNLDTINTFFGENLTPDEARVFIEEKRVRFPRITNFQEYVLDALGRELYEAFYHGYTLKQWGLDPCEIPVSTARRLPVRFDRDDRYFTDPHQGIPDRGYGALFENLLDHEKIRIILGCSHGEMKGWQKKYDLMVFTGSIDEYFDYRFGELPYRSVRFEKMVAPDIQGCAVVNYCDAATPFTRIHEHRYFTPDRSFSKSIGFREFSHGTTSRSQPFYPIETRESRSLLKAYQGLAVDEEKVIFLGRLGNFQYLNMDQVIEGGMRAYGRSGLNER